MLQNKVYPQSVRGKFRTIKDRLNILLLFIYITGSGWRWDRSDSLPNQAILIDLPNRKGFFFNIQIWPNDVFLVTIILVIAALLLLIAASIFGRIWCGFTCPHTVFTDIFIKIEIFFQGDRNQRIAAAQNIDITWLRLNKCLTYISWLIVSFAFAFFWVSYFYDALFLLKDLWNFNVSYAALVWLIGLTTSTYYFAGIARDKICKNVCPYGRFQSAMIEDTTKLVTYNNSRGEPRGKSNDSGDCIDCYKCVMVCPMGIDIRDGLQMACINCGLCIDACDDVMTRINKPRGLIKFQSLLSLDKVQNSNFLNKFYNIKIICFIIVFTVFFGLLMKFIVYREDLNLNIISDNRQRFTMTAQGDYRNIYNIKIYNKSTKQRKLELFIVGLPNYSLKSNSISNISKQRMLLYLEPGGIEEIKVFIDVPPLVAEVKEIKFILKEEHKEKIYSAKSSFFFKR